MAADLLFLILILGIPLAVITLLTRIVMRKMFVSAVFAKLADSNGWKYTKSGGGSELQGILDGTLFKTRGGNHRLYNILETGGTFLCDYHYSNRGIPGHRRGSNHALVVVDRKKSSPVFWAVRRYENTLGKSLEDVVGDSLETVDDPGWNWLLLSSAEEFKKAGWTSEHNEALGAVMEQGSALYLSEDKIIITLPGYLHTRKIVDLKQKAEALSDLL